MLLDATGSMETVRLQRFPHQARKGSSGIDIVEILGQLEVSAHGIIGLGWSPDKSVTVPQELVPFSHGPNSLVEHEGPYCHVHIVVSSASQTVCGHLMEGSQICRNTWNGKAKAPSHFSVAIAKVAGVILRATYDRTGYYHDIVAT